MKTEIEKIILETLVIENKQSIHHAVDKIDNLIIDLLEWASSNGYEYYNEDCIWAKDGILTNICTSTELLELFIKKQYKTKQG